MRFIGKRATAKPKVYRNALPDFATKPFNRSARPTAPEKEEKPAEEVIETPPEPIEPPKPETPEPKRPLGQKTEPPVEEPAPDPEPEPEAKPEPEKEKEPEKPKEPKQPSRLSQALRGRWQQARQLTKRAAAASRRLSIVNKIWQKYWLPSLATVTISASQVSLFLQPTVGTFVCAGSLALLIGLALWQEKYRTLCISAALLPLSMTVMLSLPPTNSFIRVSVFYAILLLMGLTYRYLILFSQPTPEQTGKLGRKGYLIALPAMIVIGQVLGLAMYGLLRNQFNFTETPAAFIALTAVVFALAEEVVFRGLLQHQFAKLIGTWGGAVFAGIAFAAVSAGNSGWRLALPAAIIMSASLSIIYAKKPNIMLTWIVNATCKIVFIGLLSAIS